MRFRVWDCENRYEYYNGKLYFSFKIPDLLK